MLYSWSLFCYLPGTIEGFWVLMRAAWIVCKGTWFWHVIVKIIRFFLYRWPFRLSPKRSAWKIEHLPFFCANSTCRVNEFFFKKARTGSCLCLLLPHVVHSRLHKRTLTYDDVVLTDMYCLCKYWMILKHNDVQFSPFIRFYK